MPDATRFEYGLADRSAAMADADLRRLMAQTPMPGGITVAFEREPSYFLGTGLHGARTQVITVRERATSELAGMGVRCAAPYYVNGHPTWLGYFGELRIAQPFRRQGVLHGSEPFLRALHEAEPYPAYLGVIAAGNDRARHQLVDVRGPGFPPVYRVAHIRTHGVIVRRPPRRWSAAVQRATADDLPAIIACLQEAGMRRQLYPQYNEADFLDSARLRGFDVSDFVVVKTAGRVVALAGLWDQRAFKQQVVRGYRGGLRLLRPFYNGLAPLLGMQPLPAVGRPIESAFAAFIAVTDDDPDHFDALLSALLYRAAERRLAYLMVGLVADDPLLPVLRRYPHVTYHSDLFLTGWDDVGDFVAHLDDRPPYVEIAAL